MYVHHKNSCGQLAVAELPQSCLHLFWQCSQSVLTREHGLNKACFNELHVFSSKLSWPLFVNIHSQSMVQIIETGLDDWGLTALLKSQYITVLSWNKTMAFYKQEKKSYICIFFTAHKQAPNSPTAFSVINAFNNNNNIVKVVTRD